MDEKDRTIVTFDGDDTETTSPHNNFSLDVDLPERVTSEAAPSVQASPYSQQGPSAQARPSVQPGQYPQPGQSAQASPSVQPGQYSQSGQSAQARPSAQPGQYSQPESRPTAPAGSDYQARHAVQQPQTRRAQAPLKPVRDPRYVTKGALVICMILTMLISTLLGAFLGGAFSARPSGGSSETSQDDNREPRNDSDLSQLSLSDATGSEMTISEIVDKNADAVVEILVSGTTQDYFGQMQVTEGAGSGVIVTADGYIVTNYHVIQGANKVQVTLHDGSTYPAVIIGGVDENDIAVIKINATGLTVAEFGDSSKVKVGDTAVAIGNPLGQLGGTATTGIISALDRTLTIEGRTMTLMQTDAAINGGNSGGGLFNSKGELIGIVDAKSSGVGIEGLAFAIPINTVADIINDLVANGKVTTRPVVGITMQDVSEANAENYNQEAKSVYIAQVTGENAKTDGLQPGDRIIDIDGKEIKDSQAIIPEVKKHKVGDTVSIVVSRQGQEIEIKTVLEELTTTE